MQICVGLAERCVRVCMRVCVRVNLGWEGVFLGPNGVDVFVLSFLTAAKCRA